MEKLTSTALKNELWTALLKVKTGEMTPETAKAIAYAGREILRTVNTEINLAVLSGRKPSQKLLTNARR